MPAALEISESGAAYRPILNDKDKITVLGFPMLKNDDNWHWVFTFPLEHDEETKKKFAEVMPEAEKAWTAIFTGAEGSGKSGVKPKMTRKEFQHAVFEEMVDIMSGPRCGLTLGTHVSIDGDELFLMVSLENQEAITEIAEISEYRTMIASAAYKEVDIAIPTDSKLGPKFDEIAEGLSLDRVYFKSETTLFNHYPATVTYRKGKANRLEHFRNPDLIRLSQRRMQHFFNFNSLDSYGAINQVFAVHNWDRLEALHQQGWNDPTKLIYWPAEGSTDNVSKYFYSEIAFQFHWYNLFTRFMAAPALLSVVSFLLRTFGGFDSHEKSMITCSFAVFICIWSSVFMAYYNQKKNLKILRWGMKNFNDVGAAVRKEFSDEYRDTWKETLQNGMHWFLCCFFIAETLGIISWIAAVRSHATQEPEGMTWGISNVTVASTMKYLVTINIKVVDKLWTALSSYLTSKENWRTQTDLKGAMVLKLFTVKFVVFYYPFFYTIFLKPHIEGCPGGGIDACVVELNSSLMVFFITQIVTEMAMLVIQLALTYKAVKTEIAAAAKKTAGSQEYSYLELQAKAAPYGTIEQMEDFMNQVVSYGFIVMFSVTLPFMCFLSFVTNFMYKKLIAYKICYAQQRPDPNGSEGIGSWEYIISNLSYIGVFVNAYIAVFALPLMNDLELTTKIIIFIAAEHGMLLVKLLIDAAFGDKSTAQLRIEEHNDDFIDQVMNGKTVGSDAVLKIDVQSAVKAVLKNPYK
ncbi:unnamed protein product [Polarella glacialis]|uniref:Anoctamin transmembrane domain-containing protein n=2 Tax=Polarella glacialis TaxID=89957 RepID=A0A813IJA2_POLGL|nr:unnamed protein product [Polarella glacialis]